MKNKTIAIIGAGNLGIAIYKGIQKGGLLDDNKLILTKRDTSEIDQYKSDVVTVSQDNIQAAKEAQIIILAVQPAQLTGILLEIKPFLKEGSHTLISVVTAIEISKIEKIVGTNIPVVRSMPNTAVAVLKSMTCIAANEAAKSELSTVQMIFNCVGTTMIIHEELMQAATVVCASGIAFWMRFIRATTQGGVQLGFDAEDAQKIAVQTCLGAATLLEELETHPEKEIDRVTTPKGCTISGLNEMEHNGLSSALIKGLVTSYERITSMKEL